MIAHGQAVKNYVGQKVKVNSGHSTGHVLKDAEKQVQIVLEDNYHLVKITLVNQSQDFGKAIGLTYAKMIVTGIAAKNYVGHKANPNSGHSIGHVLKDV